VVDVAIANDSFSRIVALLILTGQRRTEIGSLQHGWIDKADNTITLPSSITKKKRTHVFPHGSLVASVVDRVTNTHDTYLFPASRDHVRGKPTTNFNGWPKQKRLSTKNAEFRTGRCTIYAGHLQAIWPRLVSLSRPLRSCLITSLAALAALSPSISATIGCLRCEVPLLHGKPGLQHCYIRDLRRLGDVGTLYGG
jgi:hypothetical protein